MSQRNDLTRWNRAGLSRFDYVDGNAVEYLEILRKQLVRHFADTETGQCDWINPAQQIPANEIEEDGEALVQRQQRLSIRNRRLLETYLQDRRDWAWEISRSFARCCHMLTEHANAYANEGFLGTATQWDHVRMLVEMLDYHPAPPASASTWISIQAKPGKSANIASGFQLKNSPPSGADKVVFETLRDIYIDAALNEIRPLGWNRSDQPMNTTAAGGAVSEQEIVSTRWLAAVKPALESGEVGIVVDESHARAEAITISEVKEIEADPVGLELELTPSPVQNSWSGWAKGDTLLNYSSRWHKTCWLNGVNVIRTRRAHGLSAESYVGWKVGGQWRYAKVAEADKRDLRLDYEGAMPEPGSDLYQLRPIESNIAGSNLEVVVLLDGADGAGDNMDAVEDVPLTVPESPGLDHIFTVKDLSSDSSSVTLPPLLPPGALPGIGSFLFPTPFLPIDLVKAAVELMLNLGVMVIPSTGEIVIKGLPMEGLLEGVDNFADAAEALYDMMFKLEIPDSPGDKLVEWGSDTKAVSVSKLETLLEDIATGDTPMFQQIRQEIEQSGPLLALGREADRIARVVSADPLYMFNSTPDRIKARDWVAVEFSDGLRALKIKKIEKFIDEDKTESFSLSFENLPALAGELKRVHADFRGELTPQEANINLSPIEPENFQVEQIPEGLKVGRELLVTGCGDPYQTKVSAIEGKQISFDPPLSPCLAGNMVIHGNVVLAGHGESQPQKIIGSGNAAKSNQEIVLEVAGLSFIPDATKSAGVAAAVEVEVEGRLWEQVSSLKDSLADDHHYETRMTEDGFVKIIFGDGRNGRRLPTGKNNIRVRYRVGSGIAGNVPANSLNKAIKPDPQIESVAQPMAATGGGDMEDQESLRENAPPTLLALKRAVSLSDFSHLAAAQSNIWQAKAFSELLHAGRMQTVIVIVVPAGGVFSAEIKNDLETYLQKHALPAVQVRVESYTPKTVNLSVIIRVDTDAFVPQEVENDVAAEIIRQLGLQYRGLGKPLYLSEIYKIVENIEGVENSICTLNEGVSVVRADDRGSLVHLDVIAGSSLDISSEEYRP